MVPFHLPARRRKRKRRVRRSPALFHDARDFPTAAAASSAAAGKERDACAEVALPPEGGTKPGRKKRDKPAGRETSRAPSEKNALPIPPGSEPLPADGSGFVDALHKHVDLYLACARLVKSTDEKIAQRMAERLLEMKYGKGPAATVEEAPEIVIDIDSAVAKRAAEGANR